MSVFFSQKLCALSPYAPGEQPQDRKYIKLNTNENPYFPSKYAIDKITSAELENLRLYSDPECSALSEEIAAYYGVNLKNVLPSNGSDEALAFAFAAFGGRGVVFPDITYGFYKVFAAFFGESAKEIPLKEDFTIDSRQFEKQRGAVFLANPNAQTGIFLPIESIEKIVASRPDRVTVVDEAYVDFGGESCVPLTKKYKNLLVVQTFSKSRSLAGARVGFAIGDEELIADLKRVKFSFNPYNVNRLSSLLACEAIKDGEYFDDCRNKIIKTRQKFKVELESLGFYVLPSEANFVLARHEKTGGEELYKRLKEMGILVRHFDDERIKDYVRITIGTDGEMAALIGAIKEIL